MTRASFTTRGQRQERRHVDTRGDEDIARGKRHAADSHETWVRAMAWMAKERAEQDAEETDR